MNKNLLAAETSPYLLQHRNNPVNWQPWNPATLKLAKDCGKPILLSIGYSSCHWCHVMAHESFENHHIAGLMNELFTNIKVDKEERPDLDAIYQKALALMGVQGGWPLTMFLTPDGLPFWGATYIAPTPRYGQPGLANLLETISNTYSNEIDSLLESALIVSHALTAPPPVVRDRELSIDYLDQTALALAENIDPVNGGFRGAPKFPTPPTFEFLWNAFMRTGDQRLGRAVTVTLDGICAGGIYDHLGGGFSRYATDEEWLVPHFEKMLCDNAQIIDLLGRVWLETRNLVHPGVSPDPYDHVSRFLGRREGADDATPSASLSDTPRERETRPKGRHCKASGLRRTPFVVDWHHGATRSSPEALQCRRRGQDSRRGVLVYADRVGETISWCLREMTVAGRKDDFAFASGFDADSDGEEGTFYVWTKSQIAAELGDDADLFIKTYGVTSKGNWQGGNIFHRDANLPPKGKKVESRLGKSREILRKVREKRPWPDRDDKVLADWNGLMIVALVNAGLIFREAEWVSAGESVFSFIQKNMTSDDRLSHSLCKGEKSGRAFIDDYAEMSRAALALFKATENKDYLAQAEDWVATANRFYWDCSGGGYFFSASDADDVIIRTKTAADGATPSGNGAMMNVLADLYHQTGNPAWRKQGEQLVRAFTGEIYENDAFMPCLLNGYELMNSR